MTIDDVMVLVTAFVLSWQVKVLAGLILVDIGLGIASSLRQGTFDLAKLAKFYGSMVIPYLLGYLVLYIAVNFIIPPDSLGDVGEYVNVAMVNVAWAAIVLSLGSSIKDNFVLIYQVK